MILEVIVILGILLAISCPCASAGPGDFPRGFSSGDTPGSSAIRWGPYITGTTSHATSIHVWTHDFIPVILEYSPEEDGGIIDGISLNLTSGDEDVHHIFALRNLDPGTWYHYRIIADGRRYGDYRFMTYPQSGPVSFVVYGDTRDELPRISQEDRHRLVADAIADEPGVALIVHTGDLVHDGGNISDWDRFFSTGARMLANASFAPVMGNHERNSTLYFKIFRSPANYTIEAGDFFITILDSNDWSWDTLPYQSAWLSESLTEDIPWKFVALHHPIYSSDEKHWGGFENLRKEWEPIFRESGVVAVFQGHVHLYERDAADGITYITEARGGAPWYALAEEKIPEYRKSSENTVGYSLIIGESGSPVVRLKVKTVYPGRGMRNDNVGVIEEIILYPHDTASGSIHQGIIKSSLLPLHLSAPLICLSYALQDPGCVHPSMQCLPDSQIIPFVFPEEATQPNPSPMERA